ncbi:unnamed protein product [marine sediment metagenome]|uniref:Uncharacterized protein n=1 Tax=marine sediment metagenome TaxID=412755 RepID=X1A0C1_9ZZZZ
MGVELSTHVACSEALASKQASFLPTQKEPQGSFFFFIHHRRAEKKTPVRGSTNVA